MKPLLLNLKEKKKKESIDGAVGFRLFKSPISISTPRPPSDLVVAPFRLWQHVTRAINNKDQTEATNEKFILEEAQRKSARERKAKCEEWIPALFEQDPVTGEWHYRYAE